MKNKFIFAATLCALSFSVNAGQAEYKACMNENTQLFSLLDETIRISNKTIVLFDKMHSPPPDLVERVHTRKSDAEQKKQFLIDECERHLGIKI